jgi:hypothetical protein
MVSKCSSTIGSRADVQQKFVEQRRRALGSGEYIAVILTKNEWGGELTRRRACTVFFENDAETTRLVCQDQEKEQRERAVLESEREWVREGCGVTSALSALHYACYS